MRRVLLDQNVAFGVVKLLEGFEVRTAFRLGWAGLSNGDLLLAAEEHGFEDMVTADQNISHQQILEGRLLTLVVLTSGRWSALRASAALIGRLLRMLCAARHGS